MTRFGRVAGAIQQTHLDRWKVQAAPLAGPECPGRARLRALVPFRHAHGVNWAFGPRTCGLVFRVREQRQGCRCVVYAR